MQCLALDYFALIEEEGQRDAVEDLPVKQVNWHWEAPPLAAALMQIHCPVPTSSPCETFNLVRFADEAIPVFPEAQVEDFDYLGAPSLLPAVEDSWTRDALVSLLPEAEALDSQSRQWLAEYAAYRETPEVSVAMKQINQDCEWMHHMAGSSNFLSKEDARQAKVRSLDLTRLGVEALPSIWSFEASGRTALDFSGPADGVGSGARFVRDGHLQFECSSTILEAGWSGAWTLAADSAGPAELPLPQLEPLKLPEDLEGLFQKDAKLRFVEALEAAPLGEVREGRTHGRPMASEERSQCPEWRHDWIEYSSKSPPTWQTDETRWERRTISAHAWLLSAPQQAAANTSAAPVVEDAGTATAGGVGEKRLAQQLNSGTSLAWLAYREKIQCLEKVSSGNLKEDVPDLEELDDLLKTHEARLKELPEDDSESKTLDVSLYRLLYNLRVMLSLRGDLLREGLGHAILAAVTATVAQLPQKETRGSLLQPLGRTTCGGGKVPKDAAGRW
eukprot:g28035.t1